jgi:hypothetical protein
MQFFTAIIASSALIATTSASPIKLAARATCGSAPAGSGSQKPLSQPTGITTAAACQANCEANTSCLSFVFGMVNNADECMLYSVAAASVPKQSSTNLIVYDKACTSVPAVVPTASNPTGSNAGSNAGSNNGANHKLSVRATCGSAPSGSGSQTPLSQPTGITTASACQAQCDANSGCLSFIFGMVDNADQCMLYSVAASALPKQTSTNLVAYDKACTSVPSVVPTASNPQGLATSSSSSGNTGSTGSSNQGTTPAQGQHKRANTCGAAPTGPSNKASPISTPSNIDSVAACKAQCQADTSCKS